MTEHPIVLGLTGRTAGMAPFGWHLFPRALAAEIVRLSAVRGSALNARRPLLGCRFGKVISTHDRTSRAWKQKNQPRNGSSSSGSTTRSIQRRTISGCSGSWLAWTPSSTADGR